MGNRLSKISTRTGDQGTTGLADGTRHAKDSLRIEVLGTVDEFNSAIGVVLSHGLPAEIEACLLNLQHGLMVLGGELALPGEVRILEADVGDIDKALSVFNRELPPLREFVLPGGSPAAAACHQARAICRRAERRLVSLGHGEVVNPESLIYLNRTSDLLFVIARCLARAAGEEVLWQPECWRGGAIEEA